MFSVEHFESPEAELELHPSDRLLGSPDPAIVRFELKRLAGMINRREFMKHLVSTPNGQLASSRRQVGDQIALDRFAIDNYTGEVLLEDYEGNQAVLRRDSIALISVRNGKVNACRIPLQLNPLETSVMISGDEQVIRTGQTSGVRMRGVRCAEALSGWLVPTDEVAKLARGATTLHDTNHRLEAALDRVFNNERRATQDMWVADLEPLHQLRSVGHAPSGLDHSI